MTKFLDGPAKGQVLALHTSPPFLRVTLGADGKFDALDRPEDTPRPDERLFAYKLVENLGMCHVNMGRGRGGFYPMSKYSFIESQPFEHELRSGWEKWVSYRGFLG
jgi:hypothetical protein